MRQRRQDRMMGFTLVELLVVIAILGLLAGIVFASTGRVRERARQAVCISNLRQLGQAITLYRQDYDGSESANKPWEMGFPPSPFHLVDLTRPTGGRYLKSKSGDEILHCPSKVLRLGEDMQQGRWCDYTYHAFHPDTGTPLPPFAKVLAERGGDLPLMGDVHHDMHMQRRDRPHKMEFLIVLRLDGRVSMVRVPKDAQGWQW